MTITWSFRLASLIQLIDIRNLIYCKQNTLWKDETMESVLIESTRLARAVPITFHVLHPVFTQKKDRGVVNFLVIITQGHLRWRLKLRLSFRPSMWRPLNLDQTHVCISNICFYKIVYFSFSEYSVIRYCIQDMKITRRRHREAKSKKVKA